MLIADLKGKLTIHEDVSEDFLTSSVFSTFDFLPSVWLREFMNTAINLKGIRLDFPSCKNKLIFWKRFSLPSGEGVEPDLIIVADNIAFIIEAKFYSGKSGSGFGEEEDISPVLPKSELIDQLAREYFLGKDVLEGSVVSVDEEVFDISDFFLILVTRNPCIPSDEIEESISVIETAKPKERETARDKIFWTKWQSICPIMEEAVNKHPKDSFEKKISSQLYNFLQRRDLILFNGFDFLNSLHITDPIGDPIFYQRTKRIYWSQKIFRRPLHLRGPNMFYFPRTKTYWKNFPECPKKVGKIFYGITGGDDLEN